MSLGNDGWRSISIKLSSVKKQLIKLGIYKPARWVVDHIVDRSRLRAHSIRVALLRDVVSRDDLCFDVGANIGDYTATLLAVGARVIAVDPQPSAIEELRVRFRGDRRLFVEPVALGAKAGTAEFYIRDHHGASSFLRNWGPGGYKETLIVPIVTIQSLIEIYGVPNYVKLDVEGYELQVVLGLESKIDLISFEYHLTHDDCASKLEVIKILEQFGALSFNILPDAAEAFFWPTFVSSEKFHEMFPRQLRKDVGSFYGDIFVKIS